MWSLILPKVNKMSYREEKENLGQKWKNSEFRRLFMEMLPKLLLGTVVGVAAVTASTSQVFRKPNIDFNYLYIEEETLHYEVNIDAIDSNIEVESLVIRLEANNDMQEIEGVLGLQSGTFSIVLNRQYNFTIRGDIGFGEQIFYEKKIKAEAKPYIKMNDFSQYGDELLLDFDLFNISQIKDQKITIQILSGLETIYMEDHEAVSGYYLRIPGVKINQTYELRIIANSPKRNTIYEEKLTTNNLPTVNIYYGAHGSEIFYELIIEDHFNMLRGNIEVELISGSKVIETNTHKQDEMDGHMIYGNFLMEELVQGDFGIVVKGKVGLKEQILLKETIYIYPYVYVNYELTDSSIIGLLEIDEYLTDEYQIYAALEDVESGEIIEVLITEELSFEIIYDKFRNYYLSLVLIRNNNNERYEIFGPIYIKGITPPITGELIINSANISYNSNQREYEIILEMTNTYPVGYFERYEVEVVDNSIRYDFSYSDTLLIPIDSINPSSVIKVYGYKDGVLNNLDERPLDNEIIFATVELYANNNSFDYFVIPYNVDSLDNFELNVVATDSLGEIYSETLLFNHGHGFGEMSIVNYGNTYVELVYEEVVIGGGTVFVLPTASISCTSLETSFIATYSFGNTNVTESVRMEVYLNDQFLQNGYTNEIEIYDAIDGNIYEIRLILIGDIEYEIIRYQYLYQTPMPPETISITYGEYFNPTAGSTSYKLLINFSHTYVNPETEVVFIIRNNAGEIGRYQTPLIDNCVELEVDQIYPSINVLITDLYQNILFEFENINLVFPPPSDGELIINNAYIAYNNDYKQYEIILEMTSTYPENYFDSYSFQIVDENLNTINELTYDYADFMSLPLTEEPNLLYRVIVYGHIDRNKHKLAESSLNQQQPLGILSLTPGNNRFTFGITLLEPIPDPTATIEILVIDAMGEVISQLVSYETLDGEMLVDNYGNTAIEIYYNGDIIGGGSVYILPTAELNFSTLDQSFVASADFGNTNIIETISIEAYLNDELIVSTDSNELIVNNAVDLATYTIKVSIIVEQIKYEITTAEYTYINPSLHNTITITGGEYINISGNINYKLKINFTETFINRNTVLIFNVDNGISVIGEYQVPVTNTYLEIEVLEEFTTINITVKDLNDNVISTHENIPLTFAPVTGNLSINDAYIAYNNDFKQYEIMLDMTLTYPQNYFEKFSFAVLDANLDTISEEVLDYSSFMSIPIANPDPDLSVVVYGYKDQEKQKLAQSNLNSDVVFGTIVLDSGNNLFTYEVTLYESTPNESAVIEIHVDDSKGSHAITPITHLSLTGEISVVNYGTANVELYYDNQIIGGGEVFILPTVEIIFSEFEGGFIGSLETNENITEPLKIEAYLNSELLQTSNSNETEIQNAVDLGQYQFKVYLISDVDMLIYTKNYKYINPTLHNTISITNGQYTQIIGTTDYKLKINFTHTFIDQSTNLKFIVDYGVATIGEYQVALNVGYLEIEVPQEYEVINVRITDLNDNHINTFSKISLINAPALGELSITNASIIYYNDYKRYEILMQMESTYPSGHFSSYSFEMQNANQETIESFNYSYEPVIGLPFTSLISVYQVAVYGYINQEAELLAKRILDNSEIYAEITLTPYNNLVMYDITLKGAPADPNATYEIVGTDSQNVISSIPIAYDSLMGELPVDNYGNTQVELLYNGIAIGGANVFVYPEVFTNYTAKNWSLEWSYDFDNQTVIETTRVEIYHNNELVKSSYDSQIVIQYPIDGDTYIYKVIMENPDRIIYMEELIYTNPYLQDEIHVSGGEYFNPEAGNDDYTLRIYFENTYTDINTVFLFEISIEAVTFDPNEALASDTYVEFLVPQIYTNITVTVKDMYGTVILVSENISLTMPW